MSETSDAKFIDYYKLLGISTQADSAVIRARYVQLAKRHHPDAGGSDTQMRLLNKAYKTLANGTTRAAYDMLHGLHTGQAGMPTYQYVEAPAETGQQSSDEYIDMFLDQVYREVSAQQAQASSKHRFSKIFGQ
ncbi:DnaJ domain-containing protein [Candidatus Saccharibacteria bacterium]|nr:DnaJ domain-containing protein [Candidatus Saccharibacteria bacterium]